jgi:hypothetical protein
MNSRTQIRTTTSKNLSSARRFGSVGRFGYMPAFAVAPALARRDAPCVLLAANVPAMRFGLPLRDQIDHGVLVIAIGP